MIVANLRYLIGIPILISLYYISRINFLFFHSLVEIFSVIIAGGIFIVVWNSRQIVQHHYFLFIGIGYLFVALLDLLHTFALPGLGILNGQDANLHTQLWLASRYLESISFLLAPLFMTKKIDLVKIVCGYSLFVFLMVASIFWWEIFPACYVGPDGGLTLFKKISEFIICLILLAVLVSLAYHRKFFNKKVLTLLSLSVTLTIAAELFLTFYNNAEGLSYFLGHVFKLISFYLLYKAIIETSLTRPFELIFRELKVSEERFRNIYDTAPLAFVIWDKECQVTHWNHSAEKIFGWSAQEVIGHNFFDFLLPEKNKPLVDDVVSSLLAGELANRSINENLTKSGKTIYCEWNNSVLNDEEGDIEGVLSLALDITDQRNAEEALKKSSENIKKFAYSVAHDLKNPSISLYGLTNQLSKKYGNVLDDRAKLFCDQILKISEQIGSLVENINIFISAKELPAAIETINMEELLSMVREEFSFQLISRDVSWRVSENMPDIRADRLSLLRVMRNLIDNALKYGGDTLSEIRVDYYDCDDSHVLSISDNGVGLKEGAEENIFGIFKRDESSRGIVGTGLGLAIVKEIAEKSNGAVWVESELGKGAAFYFTLSKKL